MVITIKTPIISVNKLYRGIRYLTPEAKTTKEAIAWEVKSQWKKDESMMSTNIGVKIKFFVSNGRADLDNMLKGLLDCLTGIIYTDDSQIVEIHCFKRKDKENPRVELEIFSNQ